MKVGLLGSGDVSRALAKGFLALGHEVKLGAREANNEKLAVFVKEAGSKASQGTFADAATFGDIVVLATLGTATENAVKLAGEAAFDGKVVLDTTNPLDFSTGKPALAFGWSDSLGERIQRAIPKAHVVKAFNTVGNVHMFKPRFQDGTPDMFIAGNDEAAKQKTTALLTDFGWGTVDLGGIEASRYLEPMCLAWVVYGMKTGTFNHAFKLLRR